ncbi:MAG: NAD(P)/FAD-dependent oxidoreductase [Burkholderiaceae bacterium]
MSESNDVCRPRVAVVGGGLLGMTMALRLAQAGAAVTLYERHHQAGGLAAGSSFGPYRWDRFYHVILLSDLRTRGLLAELGLSGQLRWGVTRTGFYTDGNLYSMSNAIEFLRFPPLGLIDKLRLGATIFFASRVEDPRPLEQMLATDWLGRWSGRRVLERIWLPLLKSKLGENYRIASAAFIWAIIARMYAARRSGIKREMFGWIDGGYELLIDHLNAALQAAGVTCEYGARIHAVPRSEQGARVRLEDGSEQEFDAAVLTTPPRISAALCPDLPAESGARLRDVPTQGVICASILTREPLSPYYVTNITDRWVPFTGVIEMTTLVDRSVFGGHNLVYMPLYLPVEDPAWNEPDEVLRERFLAALEKMYPHFHREQVLDFSVSRARNVLAVSTLDYSNSVMPAVRADDSARWFISGARIAYGTLNVNETLGLVEAELPALLKDLGLNPRGGARAAASPQKASSTTTTTVGVA